VAVIRFENIRVTDAMRIDLVCTVTADESDNRFDLWFEFSRPVAVSDDSIGIALSTLCGRAYSAITYDLAISDETKEQIRGFTLASVGARSGNKTVRAPRSGLTLSFSGGFDSLAALSLMPSQTRLVSMDFGGRFSRERTFFESFDTTMVSTNLLSTPLSRNSWSFMGAGAILVSEDQGSRYHTFGSILEAGPDNLRVMPAAAANNTFPPFKAAGFTNAPYVAGLTEVGTLIVLGHYQPDLIPQSLASLASPGEEKLYRKKVLAEIVSERIGMNFAIPDVVKPPKPHFKFGQNFALDFLSFYVTKFGGRKAVDGLVAELPDEVERAAGKLDLTLFERANSTLYSNFPSSLFGGLAAGLAEAGMPFYTEHDWHEYQTIREILTPYHPAAAKN
jgi:hypothetical protein